MSLRPLLCALLKAHIYSKCKVSLFGLEVIPLNVSDLYSVDFIVTQFLIKIFNPNIMDIIGVCRDYFGFDLPGVMIEK